MNDYILVLQSAKVKAHASFSLSIDLNASARIKGMEIARKILEDDNYGDDVWPLRMTVHEELDGPVVAHLTVSLNEQGHLVTHFESAEDERKRRDELLLNHIADEFIELFEGSGESRNAQLQDALRRAKTLVSGVRQMGDAVHRATPSVLADITG